MSEFISASDISENMPSHVIQSLREEVAQIRFRLRRHMDQGLTPDEMTVVSAEEKAVEAAEEILSKVINIQE